MCSHRLELEDLEMKNNSAIKQLMREFNTQMALKETELDTAVKEAIGETAKNNSPFNKLKWQDLQLSLKAREHCD